MLLAIALVFVFLIINGIWLGISDSNPISAAFVLTVFMLAASASTTRPAWASCAPAILLISVSIGGDMQQDRSTGWRLGTNRIIQFRYQVIGVFMGAVLAVGFATLFMGGNPILLVDQTDPTAYLESLPEKDRPAAEAELKRWSSAMTLKFAGALDDFIGRPEPETIGNELTQQQKNLFEARLALVKELESAKSQWSIVFAPLYQAGIAAIPANLRADNADPVAVKTFARDMVASRRAHKKAVSTEALLIGLAIGLATEGLRKWLKTRKRYLAMRERGTAGFAFGFAMDTIILPSPYASSFGGFVPFSSSFWFGMGGIFASYAETQRNEAKKESAASATGADGEAKNEIPDDMSTNSLVGGGIIAGDALSALGIGVAKLAGG